MRRRPAADIPFTHMPRLSHMHTWSFPLNARHTPLHIANIQTYCFFNALSADCDGVPCKRCCCALSLMLKVRHLYFLLIFFFVFRFSFLMMRCEHTIFGVKLKRLTQTHRRNPMQRVWCGGKWRNERESEREKNVNKNHVVDLFSSKPLHAGEFGWVCYFLNEFARN